MAWFTIKFVQTSLKYTCAILLTDRKICKTCKCKPEEHDIKSVEEEAHKLVVHSLFSKDSSVGHIRDYFRKMEEANKNKGQQSEYAKQFAWVPPGLQQGVVSVLYIYMYVKWLKM